MGIDSNFGLAFAKGQMAGNIALPTSGKVFISVCDPDKHEAVAIGQRLAAMGFKLLATGGTHKLFSDAGVKCTRLPKLAEGRPNIADMITNHEVDLLLNTPTRRGPTTDEGKIRALATLRQVPLITTITGAKAAVDAIAALKAGADETTPAESAWSVKPLQHFFPKE